MRGSSGFGAFEWTFSVGVMIAGQTVRDFASGKTQQP